MSSKLSTGSIRIACWNIDGMFQRIGGQRHCKLEDEFVKAEISQFDIVGLLETHCGPNESLLLDGYIFKTNTRKKTVNSNRYFGGIAVGIKHEIKDGITILPVNNSAIMWLRLNIFFLSLGTRHLYGVCLCKSPWIFIYFEERGCICSTRIRYSYLFWIRLLHVYYMG